MQKGALSPAAIEIYCDFDGTITERDSFDYLLETLAPPLWEEIEAKWQRNEITARECMRLQTPLIAGPWPAVVRALDEVAIDPSFPAFIEWCKALGVKLNVVSDGLDRVIQHFLDREGLVVDSIWSNRLVEDAQGKFALEFPHVEDECLLGVCKCAVLKGGGQSVTRVVIGDGASDFCWAKGADLLFAKKKLLDFCREEQVNHVQFSDFDSVKRALSERFANSAPEGMKA